MTLGFSSLSFPSGTFALLMHVCSSSPTRSTLLDYHERESGAVYDMDVVPECGNKYLLAACDAHFRLFDLEEERVIQVFDDVYSGNADFVRFVRLHSSSKQQQLEQVVFVSRGVPNVDDDGNR